VAPSLDIPAEWWKIAPFGATIRLAGNCSVSTMEKKIMKRGRLACELPLALAVSCIASGILLFSGIPPASGGPVQQAASKLAITTKSLPNATVGVEYYAVIAATGGEPPYDCSGAGLPPNLAFHYTSDTIGGKATTAGAYSVVITVTDSADPPHTATATFKLAVLPAK